MLPERFSVVVGSLTCALLQHTEPWFVLPITEGLDTESITLIPREGVGGVLLPEPVFEPAPLDPESSA